MRAPLGASARTCVCVRNSAVCLPFAGALWQTSLPLLHPRPASLPYQPIGWWHRALFLANCRHYVAKRKQLQPLSKTLGQKLRSLGYSSYWEYICSPRWQKKQQQYWRSKYPKTCFVCGTKKRIQLHHRTYTRLGKERLTDLVPLCKRHHQLVHDYINSQRVAGSRNRRLLYDAHTVVKAKLASK